MNTPMQNSRTQNTLENFDNTVLELRTEINAIDDQICELLKKRLRLVFQTREVKQIDGLPKHSPERESAVIDHMIASSQGLEREYLEEVARALLVSTRKAADTFQE